MRCGPTRDTGSATGARCAEAFVPPSFAPGEGYQFAAHAARRKRGRWGLTPP